MSYYSAETPKEGALSEKLSVHYQNNNSEIFAQNFAVVILVVNTKSLIFCRVVRYEETIFLLRIFLRSKVCICTLAGN